MEALNQMGNGKTFVLKANRERNRPFSKMSREALSAALNASNRVAALSAEIRERADLAPVPENEVLSAARARLLAMPPVKTPRKPRAKKAPGNAARVPQLSAAEEIEAELASVRERLRVLEAALCVAKAPGELARVPEPAPQVASMPVRRMGPPRSRSGFPDVAPAGLAGVLR